MIMLNITFKYKDWLSGENWRTQHCTVSSVSEFIRIYGLNDDDVDYEIIEMTGEEE